MVGAVANGRKTPMGQPELRASAPHQGGPLGSSGAAPEAEPATEAKRAEAKAGLMPPTDPKTEVTAPDSDAKTDAAPTATAAKTDVTPTASDATTNVTPSGSDAKTDVVPTARDAKTDAAPSGGVEAGVKTDVTPTPGGAKTEVVASGDGVAKPADAPETGAKPADAPGTGAKPGAKPADAPETGAKPADAPGTSAKPTPPAPPAPRRAHPVRAVARAGRSTSAWAKRPSGRLVLPGVIALLLLGAAGTAGVYLVPQALDAAPAPSATPAFAGAATAASAPPASAPAGLPTASAPVGASGAPAVTTPAAQGQYGQPGQRPADALAGWAQQVGIKVSIPVVALEAYGYAELVLAKTTPSCHLSWTTIAALAKVESDHGSANGAVLGADGAVQPPIYGLPLDGKGGRQLIRDTDQGAIDGDTTYDRAVGPLQFIPQTWNSYKIDADNNGVADPNDIDDASLTAASYLCQGGRDLSKAESWWDAILSYNAVQPYARKVFEAANDYGQRSQG